MIGGESPLLWHFDQQRGSGRRRTGDKGGEFSVHCATTSSATGVGGRVERNRGKNIREKR